jgi:hypothetical protein
MRFILDACKCNTCLKWIRTMGLTSPSGCRIEPWICCVTSRSELSFCFVFVNSRIHRIFAAN